MIQYLRRFWYVLGDSRKKIPLLLSIFVITSFAEAFGIGLLGPFFAIVSNPDSIQNTPFLKNISTSLNLDSNEKFIVFICLFIAIVFVAKSFLYFFSKYYILRFSHAHRGKMIELLYKTYLNSDYDFFLSKNSSDLVNKIIVETEKFCVYVLLSILYGTANIFIVSGLLILMAATDFLLFAATLFVFIPVLMLTYVFRGKLRSWGKTLSTSSQKIIQTLNHGLGGFKETRVIGCETFFETQMSGYTQQHAKAISLINSFELLPRILIEALLVILIVFFVAASQLFLSRNTDLIISSLSVFAVASIRLLPASSQVITSLGKIPSTKHIVDTLYTDLKASKRQNKNIENVKLEVERAGSKHLRFTNEIRLLEVNYQYPGKLEKAIRDINITIKKGESIAFIGESGAGKTTLVDIILGLISPQYGDIIVDGVSIYSSLRSWQNLVGYIPQTIFLIDDTIERNIAFGVPDHLIDYENLEKAIHSAQLKDLVSQLSDGIKTRVGERGVMLSGGQRQRIGIARALYHERKILVLDEATSALDNETEELISKAIQKLSGEKTVIMIAHRLSTVKHCNKVYLLKNGKILKWGSYDEVISYKSSHSV